MCLIAPRKNVPHQHEMIFKLATWVPRLEIVFFISNRINSLLGYFLLIGKNTIKWSFVSIYNRKKTQSLASRRDVVQFPWHCSIWTKTMSEKNMCALKTALIFFTFLHAKKRYVSLKRGSLFSRWLLNYANASTKNKQTMLDTDFSAHTQLNCFVAWAMKMLSRWMRGWGWVMSNR